MASVNLTFSPAWSLLRSLMPAMVMYSIGRNSLVATWLALPSFTAMAFTVVASVTSNGAVYSWLCSVGSLPSVV